MLLNETKKIFTILWINHTFSNTLLPWEENSTVVAIIKGIQSLPKPSWLFIHNIRVFCAFPTRTPSVFTTLRGHVNQPRSEVCSSSHSHPACLTNHTDMNSGQTHSSAVHFSSSPNTFSNATLPSISVCIWEAEKDTSVFKRTLSYTHGRTSLNQETKEKVEICPFCKEAWIKDTRGFWRATSRDNIIWNTLPP